MNEAQQYETLCLAFNNNSRRVLYKAFKHYGLWSVFFLENKKRKKILKKKKVVEALLKSYEKYKKAIDSLIHTRTTLFDELYSYCNKQQKVFIINTGLCSAKTLQKFLSHYTLNAEELTELSIVLQQYINTLFVGTRWNSTKKYGEFHSFFMRILEKQRTKDFIPFLINKTFIKSYINHIIPHNIRQRNKLKQIQLILEL